MIFEQKTIKPWFIGINSSTKNDIVQSLQNAEQVLWKYNQANVSEFEDINEATDALASVSQAYKNLDKINNIGNNFIKSFA